VKYAFIKGHRHYWPLASLCKVLEVSLSGYHQHQRRQAQSSSSERHLSNAALLIHIKAIHAQTKGEYGWPRIWRALLAQGLRVGKERVRQQMAKHHISGRHKCKYKIITTDSNHNLPVAPNLLQRDFTAHQPNQVWTTDITYLPTAQGWLYLTVMLDLFSRQIVGWSMKSHMKAELVTDALRMAWFRRRPAKGLVVHSDRGSQYCSALFQNALKAYGMRSSMSRRAKCWDTQSRMASERQTYLTRAGIGKLPLH
jgi:transposase InsO family protein